jgi:hypothetical protein
MSEPELLRLAENPTIATIERMMDIRGIEWRADFEATCDAASIALFGITRADTIRPEPHPDQFGGNRGLARYHFGGKDLADYSAVMEAWFQWEADTAVPTRAKDDELDVFEFWEVLGIDVMSDDSPVLRCLHCFERQMFIALKGLMPEAKLTWDGSGSRAAQDAESWGASLAAEAANFRSRRNVR